MEPREDRADHLGEEFRETVSACRDVVRKTQSLAHVAHYSRGVYDFSVNTLEDTAHLKSLQSLGRRLGFVVNEMEQSLQAARTGSLIRIVAHTERGAVICETVVPREFVVGVCLSERREGEPLSAASDVRTADHAVSELVTGLRARISLHSQNPGGWSSEDEVEALTSIEPAREPLVEVTAEVPDRVLAACRAAVRHEDLHYVAYCADGAVLAEVDQFGHPSIAPFFTQMTVEARRTFYRGFSQELGTVARRFNRLVAGSAPGGLLMRLVLDVEQGAVYYYRLSTGSYLAGVTINQARVSGADDRLAALAIELMS
ncbi:hypothetical protein PV646_21560 [Streptomyces sp. ID05-26A]|nr:hypothetical protein [Streptomyces sp. ID05-26A]